MIAGIAAVAVIARAACLGIGADDKHVPVFELKPGTFSRTVSAEGYLRPVKATPLTAPDEGRSMLIALDGRGRGRGEEGRRGHPLRQRRRRRARWPTARTTRPPPRPASRRSSWRSSSALAERSRAAALTKEEMNQARELGKKDPRFFPRTEVIESEIDEALLGDAPARRPRTPAQVEKQLGKSRVALLAVDRQKAEMQLAEAAAR